MALFGMMTLASWHDALPHIDAVEHAHGVDDDHHAQASDHKHDHASGHHRHGDDESSDGSDVIHVAAHAVFQSVDVPAQPVLGVTLFAVATLWVMAPADRIDSVRPDSLLRPPRA